MGGVCTLKVTAGGPQGKTVSYGTDHSASGGTGCVVLEADAGTPLGVLFARGGVVRQVKRSVYRPLVGSATV